MKKILVIEDEKALRELYKLEFEDMGYAVETAETSEDGFDILKNTQFDLLILDIKLPGTDGLSKLDEEIEMLRKKGVKVIINSAYASYKESFKSWAADEFIVKSADLSQLKETIHKYLK